MRIAFIHSGKAYLPGIEAYIEQFTALGFECISIRNSDFSAENAAIHWYFMGVFRKGAIPGKLVIHEYASASVPPFAVLKDRLKTRLNGQPHLRVFLNEFVQSRFPFNDQIPYCFRDIGVSSQQPEKKITEPEFDFIFSGAVTADMKMDKLLNVFARGAMRKRSILVLGGRNKKIEEEFRGFQNIRFHDPVPKAAVPELLNKARYGINFKPNILPYARQTSTKFLEYIHAGLPVISSDLPWIRNFQQQYGGSFFLLREDLSNFTEKNIESFTFCGTSLEDWSWKNQIGRSGLVGIITEFRETGKLPG